MPRIPKAQEIYRHFKGNLYQVMAVAEHSETGEQLVIYQGLYGEFKIYARPLDSFMEELNETKYPGAGQRYRFALQGPNGGAEPEKEPGPADKAAQPADKEEPAPAEKEEPECKAAQPADKSEPECKAAQPEAEPEKEPGPADKAAQPDKPEPEPASSEGGVAPGVLRFLDAETYEEKLEILNGLRGQITDEMINTMAVACDVEVPEGALEERFRSLKACLVMLDRFECNRLR